MIERRGGDEYCVLRFLVERRSFVRRTGQPEPDDRRQNAPAVGNRVQVAGAAEPAMFPARDLGNLQARAESLDIHGSLDLEAIGIVDRKEGQDVAPECVEAVAEVRETPA